MCSHVHHNYHKGSVELNLQMSADEAVKKIKDFEFSGDLTSLEARSVFTVIARKYVWGNYDFDILEKARQLKMDYAKDILQGETAIVLKDDVAEENYSEAMFSLFLDYLKYKQYSYQSEETFKNLTQFSEKPYVAEYIEDVNLYYGRNVAKYLKENITSEELKNNALTKKIAFKGKVFNVGTKITKLLNAISEHYDDNYLKNKITGNFKMQRQDNRIILSAYPTAFPAAGYVGSSCLSPNGDNLEGSLAAMGYPNVLLAHDENFKWRAFVVLDRDTKMFTIFKGYPQENYYGQILVYEHLKSQGYTLTPRAHYFEFRWYMDSSRVWPDNEDAEFRYYNKDSYYNWEKSFIIDGYRGDMSIIGVAECEHCEMKELNELYYDGYCGNCGHDSEYCSHCEDYYDEDDMIYIEQLDRRVCNSCAKEWINENFDTFDREIKAALSYAAKNVDYLYSVPSYEFNSVQKEAYFLIVNGYDYYKNLDEDSRLHEIKDFVLYNDSRFNVYNLLGFLAGYDLELSLDYRDKRTVCQFLNDSMDTSKRYIY